MAQRIAIAWTLFVVVGLLTGLVVLVVAAVWFGRHLRRLRQRPDPRRRGLSQRDNASDADADLSRRHRESVDDEEA